MRQFSFILITIIFFNGCFLNNFVNEYDDSYKLKYYRSTAVTDFTDISNDLLSQLCDTLKKLPKSQPLTVIDFTNIKELENYSELGFVLSEEIKTLVTQKCNWSVQQLEFMRYLKVGANGTKLLSRDFQDIKNEQLQDNGYALIGTYAFTQRQLILYLKLVDLSNGVIIKSATQRTTLTDEIISLEKKPQEDRKDIYTPLVL